MKELKKVDDVLKPYGSLDLLYYYSIMAEKLTGFLRGREIATKTLLPNFFFLKRGSNSKPLFIEDLRCVDEKMLKLRAGHGLGEARAELTGKQALAWGYFVPRKLVNFFYACNGEKQGRDIERVFIDVDRRNFSSDKARIVAKALVETIKKDKEFNKLLKFRIFIMWTGSSFHIYLLLKNKVNLGFYSRYLSYGKKKEESFIMKWVGVISERTGINVRAGHEKSENFIVLDTSNTPSGKLARAPFSIHTKNDKIIDGIAVPLSEKQLSDKNLIRKLEKLKLEDILKNLNSYARLIP